MPVVAISDYCCLGAGHGSAYHKQGVGANRSRDFQA